MNLKYSILLISLFCSATMKGQSEDFEEKKNKSSQSFENFKKKQTQRFENHKQKKQLEFAEFLERKWEEFQVFSGKEPLTLPEPVDPPVATPTDSVPDVEIPTLPTVVVPPQETIIPDPEIPEIPDKVEYDKITVAFLGHDLTLNYDKAFNVALPGITENKIAEYWTKLAKSSFEELVYQCLTIKKEIRLNDWGYYLFVKKLADEIYSPGQKNEKTAFTAFVLDNSGYKVRMGRDEDYKNLMLMIAIEDQVYSKSYFVFSEKNFYLIDGAKNTAIYTYGEWKDADKKRTMNLVIKEPINVAHQSLTKVIESPVFGTNIEIEYNTHLKEFYEQMLSCDLSIFFNSECSEEIRNSLLPKLAKHLEGKSKTQQVSDLLDFIHQGFPYMTDDKQFGKEKFFFYEEAFIYPYTDCEDNSILFSYLVRKLTGLKVVGLLYHDHAATAVKFEPAVEGSHIIHNGEKYTICDPTFFGAAIGQCMPQYLSESAQVIEIQ